MQILAFHQNRQWYGRFTNIKKDRVRYAVRSPAGSTALSSFISALRNAYRLLRSETKTDFRSHGRLAGLQGLCRFVILLHAPGFIVASVVASLSLVVWARRE